MVTVRRGKDGGFVTDPVVLAPHELEMLQQLFAIIRVHPLANRHVISACERIGFMVHTDNAKKRTYQATAFRQRLHTKWFRQLASPTFGADVYDKCAMECMLDMAKHMSGFPKYRPSYWRKLGIEIEGYTHAVILMSLPDTILTPAGVIRNEIPRT